MSRRCFKLLVSLLVRCWDALLELFCLVARRPRPGRCVVIYYHAVPAPLKTRFARQMDELLKRAQPLPASHSDPLPSNKRHVVVTFDDAFRSVSDNALPELKKRRIPCAIFVPSGRLGQPPTWIRNAKHITPEERVLTREELRALNDEPLVTLASHGVTHPNLLKMAPAEADKELARSKLDLEELLGQPIHCFSYPFGAHSPELHRRASQAGYRRVFTSDPYTAFSEPKEFVTGRIAVEPDDWPIEFRLKISGAYRWDPCLRNFKNKYCRF